MSKTLELAFKTNLNKTAKLHSHKLTLLYLRLMLKLLWIILLNLIFYNLQLAHLLKATSAKLIDVTSTTLFETK